jgi:hypothetical protein
MGASPLALNLARAACATAASTRSSSSLGTDFTTGAGFVFGVGRLADFEALMPKS